MCMCLFSALVLDFLKRRFAKVWVPYAIAVLLWGGVEFVVERDIPFERGVKSSVFV